MEKMKWQNAIISTSDRSYQQSTTSQKNKKHSDVQKCGMNTQKGEGSYGKKHYTQKL